MAGSETSNFSTQAAEAGELSQIQGQFPDMFNSTFLGFIVVFSK